MNGLFRPGIETKPFWSHVGPDHSRLYFNHLDLVGYVPAKGTDGFSCYAMNGEHLLPGRYKTIPAAKREALRWVKRLVPELAKLPIVWVAEDTGMHFTATVKGFVIASYYYCPKATLTWHKGFKVWFGGTFYMADFRDTDEAKAAVAQTWREWLELATQHLLNGPCSRQ